MRRVDTMTYGLILIALVFGCCVPLSAATDAAPAVARGELPLSAVSEWKAPAVDVARLLQEDDANRNARGTPLRIGYPMTTDLSPDNSGTWENLTGGGQLWRLQVRSEDAMWLVLGFDHYALQAGGELVVHDPARRTVLGPYGHGDIRRHGELWFPPIAGDTLVVELYWPEQLRGVEPALHLATVSHGYKPFGVVGRDDDLTRDFGDSASCNIDVQCPLGDDWQDDKRGVVILLSGGSSFCTGSLINTTAGDCRPYVLTADNCGAGADTSFGFNFERPGCNSGTPPAQTNETVTGATVLAEYSGSDFTLLEMDSQPPESFDPYYNGWSRDTTPASECWGIHHPSGDAKKISYNSDALIDGANYGPTHWRITEWEQGTTEGGSAGSPLFGPDHRIVGQLHGGQASCTHLTWDEYGKIDVSWTGGSSSDTRLSDWLDPDGTGALGVSGVDYQTCLFSLAGTVDLTADLYTCTSTLTIKVRDDSLQGEASLDVTLVSDTEFVPETVTLPVEAPGLGKFSAGIPTAAIAAINGDGILSVSHADTITVIYIDADDGAGGNNIAVQDVATVDCQPPLITNVRSSNVTGSAATISWDTDEAADSSVAYDVATPPGQAAGDAALVTSHAIQLADLQECSTYVYSVTSADLVGNSASDDAGGAYHGFETGKLFQPTFLATDTPLGIPDDDPAGVSSTIGVAGDETIQDVDVSLDIAHTYTGDLTVTLTPPGGAAIALVDSEGGSGDDFSNTLFDDDAATEIADGAAPFSGSYRPESPLSSAEGPSSPGDWVLRVVDGAGGDIGTLNSWSLTLVYSRVCGPSARYDAHTLETDTCVSGGPGDTNGFWGAGEEVQFNLTVRNNGIDALTGITAHVTPLTAGVVMLDGIADLPDLAAGATTTTLSPHLTARLPQGLTCGASIDFEITIQTGSGSFVFPFAQTIGEIVTSGGILIDENFESGGIPNTWTIVDGFGDGFTWYEDAAGDPAACANTDPAPPLSGTWVAVDSDCTGAGVPMDEELITRTLDFSGAVSATIDFDHWFRRDGPEICDVDVRSSLTAGQWVNVARWSGASTTNPDHASIDITAQAAGANDVEIRWHYYNAEFEWTWFIDNVVVSFGTSGTCNPGACGGGGPAPPPVPDDMLADRGAVDGSVISIGWNDVCSPPSTKILWGPLDQVSSYTISGAECGIANPQTWDPAPAGSIWFLLVTDDGAGLESSWGQSFNGERNGSTASGFCGSSAKDPTGICP